MHRAAARVRTLPSARGRGRLNIVLTECVLTHNRVRLNSKQRPPQRRLPCQPCASNAPTPSPAGCRLSRPATAAGPVPTEHRDSRSDQRAASSVRVSGGVVRLRRQRADSSQQSLRPARAIPILEVGWPTGRRGGTRVRNRSSFGPNSTRPAQVCIGRVLACPTQVAWTDGTVAYTSRKGPASVCHRAVERRFRAIFPEGMADSDTLGL